MGSAEIQGDLWGRKARDWAELQEPHHLPLWEVMLEKGYVGAGTRILDAGCGGGGASILAAERGAIVSGIDAAAPLVEIARGRVPNGDFRVGDIQDLPFEDQVFDVVLAANSLQYSQDRVATLREMKRVSADDGRVIVGLFSAPDKVDWSKVIEAVGSTLPSPPNGRGPFELAQPNVLEGLIQQAGMGVLGIGEVECPFDFPDFDTVWRVSVSGGPTQAAIEAVGEERIELAVRDAMKPFQAADGSFHMMNMFRYVVATL
jgi:SAM-dependent methyltransferase